MIHYYPTSWRLFKTFPLGFVTSFNILRASKTNTPKQHTIRADTWKPNNQGIQRVGLFSWCDHLSTKLYKNVLCCCPPQPGPKVTSSSDQTQGSITKVSRVLPIPYTQGWEPAAWTIPLQLGCFSNSCLLCRLWVCHEIKSMATSGSPGGSAPREPGVRSKQWGSGGGKNEQG